MSATITASIVTGGTNNAPTSSEEANGVATDFVSQGTVGTPGNTSGTAPSTGSFAVNQDSSPDMGVTIAAGQAYVKGTPTGQGSQAIRANMTSNYTSYTIAANSSGSTKYDWIYLQLNPTNAANPDVGADNVINLYTSRSTSNTSDTGTPPTYGILLAVVTVANGASSITNANIADKRTQAVLTNAPSSIVAAGSGSILKDSEGNTLDIEQRASVTFQNFFEPGGCVWSISSGLVGTMTAGHVWIAGKRLTVSAIASHIFTASNDCYIDFKDNSDGTAVPVYITQANNAASPALAANSIRAAIVVTNGSAITFVNQGQIDTSLSNFGPTVSSAHLTVTDSLGNLIYPQPNQTLIGYRQITSNLTNNVNGSVQITGLSAPIIVPTGRRVRCTLYIATLSVTGAPFGSNYVIVNGSVSGGTQLNSSSHTFQSTNQTDGTFVEAFLNNPGSTTINGGWLGGSSQTITLGCSAAAPAFLSVELV